MFKKLALQCGAVVLLATAMLLPRTAQAVPSFALQTGQPCSTCHVGGFGPQLTAFGRDFKLGGYTQQGGEGWQSAIPVSVMLLSSYTNTTQGQGQPASQHYGSNGNFAMDQISLFLAGRVSENVGGFVQGTFNGIKSSFKLDNTDIRASAPFTLGTAELRAGLDVNNGPMVQDPYNSTYAWGYPYVLSALAPMPAAQPLLAGALVGNSVGVSAYAWYDRKLYLEAGLYNTYGPSLLSATGNAYGPGSTANPAPYLRAAYEWNWNGQSAHVGAAFLTSNFNPTASAFHTDNTMGRNSYTDYAIDAGYQYLGDGTNTVSLLAIFNHEEQKLNGAFNAGGSSQSANTLNQIRANIAYYYLQTYGLTLGWQNTSGTTNTLLYAPAPLTGSANGKPNSNSFSAEADWVPFGKDGAWGSPWANLKLGAQYTLYTRFNGGSSNYDGFGRRASDNNTLYLFAWMIF